MICKLCEQGAIYKLLKHTTGKLHYICGECFAEWVSLSEIKNHGKQRLRQHQEEDDFTLVDLCPRCNIGLLFFYVHKTNHFSIVICDECEGAWVNNCDFIVENAVDLTALFPPFALKQTLDQFTITENHFNSRPPPSNSITEHGLSMSDKVYSFCRGVDLGRYLNFNLGGWYLHYCAVTSWTRIDLVVVAYREFGEMRLGQEEILIKIHEKFLKAITSSNLMGCNFEVHIELKMHSDTWLKKA